MRVGTVARRGLTGAALASVLLTLVSGVGSVGVAYGAGATATCVAPAGSVVFTLSDMAPGVKLDVPIGSGVIVRTPKWYNEHPTQIKDSHHTVLRPVCSMLTGGGEREAIYEARHIGRSLLWATVTPPTDTFMPSWSGVVTVSADSSDQSTTTSSHNWKVTMWVARISTRVGTTIPAIVTVDNRTDHRVTISGCPGTTYEIVLSNNDVPNEAVIPTVLCVGTMTPGIHAYFTDVQTSYQTCGIANTPSCGKPPKIPKLPVGTYRTELILPGAGPQLPMPKPLAITITS